MDELPEPSAVILKLHAVRGGMKDSVLIHADAVAAAIHLCRDVILKPIKLVNQRCAAILNADLV